MYVSTPTFCRQRSSFVSLDGRKLNVTYCTALGVKCRAKHHSVLTAMESWIGYCYVSWLLWLAGRFLLDRNSNCQFISLYNIPCASHIKRRPV